MGYHRKCATADPVALRDERLGVGLLVHVVEADRRRRLDRNPSHIGHQATFNLLYRDRCVPQIPKLVAPVISACDRVLRDFRLRRAEGNTVGFGVVSLPRVNRQQLSSSSHQERGAGGQVPQADQPAGVAGGQVAVARTPVPRQGEAVADGPSWAGCEGPVRLSLPQLARLLGVVQHKQSDRSIGTGGCQPA